MKKVLILCLHRKDRSPSQRYRIEQYLPYLEEKGYRFTYSYLLNEKDDKIFYKTGNIFSKALIVLKSFWKRRRELRTVKEYDLAFVQREAFMLGTAWFEKKIAAKVPLIFDFDDSIWLQNVSEANRKLAFLKNPGKTKEIISVAAEVFAGNKYLEDYARAFNPKTRVIPTTIDTDWYKVPPEKQDDTVCIGWSGSFSTIQHFARVIPALQRIRQQFGNRVRFKIIGDASYYCRELDVQGLPWKAETEVEDLAELDIGLMPLPDDEWAKGKCGLKGLQYMALSVPTLMSPVGVNTEIIQHGVNGFLPETEDDWVSLIAALVEDKARRKAIGQAGRQTVLEKYSVLANRDKYLEAFNALMNK